MKEKLAPLTPYTFATMPRNILHLTLKKQWFDMILSGEKTEEYREIKPHWVKRFDNSDGTLREFDVVRFTNGYGQDKPSFDIKVLWLRVGKGVAEWGAELDKRYYVIHLGEILATYNLQTPNQCLK